jgi:carbohydrate kinase (thermoresistant glucokinase family)
MIMKLNIIILMGVAASGKTTLGKALAETTQGSFYDGDDFHSSANREKMAAGMALTDDDRKDWLQALADLIAERSQMPTPTFIACSALKETYRDILRAAHPVLAFVFLKADPVTLRQRITQRYESGEHFMPPTLLDSQLQALEPPADALEMDSTKPIAELVGLVLSRIKLEPA